MKINALNFYVLIVFIYYFAKKVFKYVTYIRTFPIFYVTGKGISYIQSPIPNIII